MKAKSKDSKMHSIKNSIRSPFRTNLSSKVLLVLLASAASPLKRYTSTRLPDSLVFEIEVSQAKSVPSTPYALALDYRTTGVFLIAQIPFKTPNETQYFSLHHEDGETIYEQFRQPIQLLENVIFALCTLDGWETTFPAIFERFENNPLRWVPIETLEPSENSWLGAWVQKHEIPVLNSTLLMEANYYIKLHLFDKTRRRMKGLGSESYFLHQNDRDHVVRPIFVETPEGLYIASGVGFISTDQNPAEDGYKIGLYKVNLDLTAAKTTPLKSIEFLGSQKNGVRSAWPRIEHHRILYKEDTSAEEKLLSSHFYYWESKSQHIGAQKIKGDQLVSEGSVHFELGNEVGFMAMKAIPGTTLLVLDLTSPGFKLFRDGEKWVGKSVLRVYRHRISFEAGSSLSGASSLKQVYEREFEEDYPLGWRFEILEDLRYIFTGEWSTVNNLVTGLNILDICESSDEIAVQKLNTGSEMLVECVQNSELVQNTPELVGCAQIMPITASCLRCHQGFDLEKKFGPWRNIYPWTRYCKKTKKIECTHPLYLNKTQDGCYDCLEDFPNCEKCSNKAHSCLSCQKGYTWSEQDSMCKKECLCGDYWTGKEHNSCRKCGLSVKNCRECSSVDNLFVKCGACGEGFRVQDNSCLKVCKDVSEYWSGREQNECKGCPENCLKCSDLTGKCLECFSGYVLSALEGVACEPFFGQKELRGGLESAEIAAVSFDKVLPSVKLIFDREVTKETISTNLEILEVILMERAPN